MTDNQCKNCWMSKMFSCDVLKTVEVDACMVSQQTGKAVERDGDEE